MTAAQVGSTGCGRCSRCGWRASSGSMSAAFECVSRTRPRHATTWCLFPGARQSERRESHRRESIARRVEASTRVSCDLSGGIDSGTITSLAAARSPLLAITYTDDHMAGQDDAVYAERLAADRTSITHAWVRGDHVGHFDALREPATLPFTDTPSLTLGLLAIKAAQLAPATAYGARLHLTGRGGDDVLDAVPAMLIDQYRAGHRTAAVHRTLTLARARRGSATAFLRRAARTHTTTHPQALLRLADTLAASTSGQDPAPTPASALAWCGTTAAARWLTPAGRTAVAELVADRAGGADPHAGPGRVHERLALELMGDGHATYDAIARQLWGIAIHAPLLDTPVVDACHAIPGWQRSVPGDFKLLARAAFSGDVPGFLLHRQTKTAFTASVYAGLRSNAPVLHRIVARSHLAQAGLLDPTRAAADLDRAARGEPAPLAGLHALVTTELWLTTLPAPRDTWWEPTPTLETTP